MLSLFVKIDDKLSYYSPEINYTVDFIFNHPLFKPYISRSESEQSDVRIYYRCYHAAKIKDDLSMIIPAQQLFFSNAKLDISSLISTNYACANSTIYGLSCDSASEAPFFQDGRFNLDLIETIFFHISRYEEVHAPIDRINPINGWLIEEDHFLVRERLEKIPIVDHIIVAFRDVLLKTSITTPAVFSMTHDIDILARFLPRTRFIRAIFGGIFYRRGFSYLSSTFRQFYNHIFGGQKDPFDTFEFLLNTSDRYEHKFVFLMSGGRTSYDNLYSIRDPKVNEIIKLCHKYNYSIGLHPSFDTPIDQSQHQDEKTILTEVNDAPILANRQHWLRWFWDRSPYQLEKLSFQLDSSLGYSQRIGFRCGTGYAYRLYNFKQRKAFSFLELPLVVMDSAVIKEALSTRTTVEAIVNHLIENNSNNTHITFNFHNSSFIASNKNDVGILEIFQFIKSL